MGVELSLNHDFRNEIFKGYFHLGWVIILAVLCGAMGACYNAIVFRVNEHYRKHVLKGRRNSLVLDAVMTSVVCFTCYFWIPLLFDCRPCPTSEGLNHRRLESTNGSGSSSSVTCKYDGHEALVRHTCADGEFNELATLLLGGQERMMTHLLSRRLWTNVASGDAEILFSTSALALLLAMYFVLAACTFGIKVPAGNFVRRLPLALPHCRIAHRAPHRPTARRIAHRAL